MRRVVVQHPAIFASLRALYANKTTGRGRSRTAQVLAAERKRKFITDFFYASHETGELVSGQAVVCYVWVIPRIDWDAPMKVVQDACQRLLFADGDDGAVRVAHITLRRPDKGATQGPTKRPALPLTIVAEAFSLDYEAEVAIERQALWTRWARARHAWIAGVDRGAGRKLGQCEPIWLPRWGS